MQSLPGVTHVCLQILCRIPFTAMLVLRCSAPVGQHPSLMKASNEKTPKQNKFSKIFLVSERLLKIKFMSYPLYPVYECVDADDLANFNNAEDPK